ncbi:hypothetical protein NDU88_004983 [Pleurodeles waltl]|uniref:Uncharacterized protein n=1 Tax=Pleurodeles waltl TaxID=8319 RepID=A0AAV7MBI5_PLEWA|nr:hypothetical protein NDU88_004983 [Pleurodeles waltl]
MRGQCGTPAPGEPRRKRAEPGASLATRPGPVWQRTLVRGSVEARRPHSLSCLRARLPSLGCIVPLAQPFLTLSNTGGRLTKHPERGKGGEDLGIILSQSDVMRLGLA